MFKFIDYHGNIIESRYRNILSIHSPFDVRDMSWVWVDKKESVAEFYLSYESAEDMIERFNDNIILFWNKLKFGYDDNMIYYSKSGVP